MPFTVVFEGEVTDLHFNPLKYESPFGKPLAIAKGDALDRIERLHELDHAARELVRVANQSDEFWD